MFDCVNFPDLKTCFLTCFESFVLSSICHLILLLFMLKENIFTNISVTNTVSTLIISRVNNVWFEKRTFCFSKSYLFKYLFARKIDKLLYYNVHESINTVKKYQYIWVIRYHNKSQKLNNRSYIIQVISIIQKY